MILYCPEMKYTSDVITITSDVALDKTIDVINEDNFYLTYYDKGIYTSVPILSGAVTVNDFSITINTETLLNNKMYDLSVFSIPGSASTNFIEKQQFKFLSIDNVNNKVLNPNNVYTQLQSLNDILSLENLIKNGENYRLKFTPTTFNTASKKVESLDETINIYNNELIIDKLVGQYFLEYKDFYTIINNRAYEATPIASYYDDDYINNLHLMFMNNIAKWYSLKGNKTFIEIMLGLYAKILGYNIISVVEYTASNFVYSISSSIPKLFWETKIKPFVHPLSWNCIYNQIDSIGGNYYQLLDTSKTKKSVMVKSWDLATQKTKLLDIRNLDKKAYQYNSIAVDNMVSETTNSSLAYTNDLEYVFIFESFFSDEFDLVELFSVSSTADIGGTHTKYNINYSKPGIFTKYEWNLFIDGTSVEITNTTLSNVSFVVINNAVDPKIQLKVYYKNGSYLFQNFFDL